MVVGGVLLANLSLAVGALAIAALAPEAADRLGEAQPGSDVDALLGLASLVLLPALLIARSRRLNAALLLLLIGANLAAALP